MFEVLKRVRSNRNYAIAFLIIGLIVAASSVFFVKKNIERVGYTYKIIEAEKVLIQSEEALTGVTSYTYRDELAEYENQKNIELTFVFCSIFLTITGIATSVTMVYFLKDNFNSREVKEDGKL